MRIRKACAITTSAGAAPVASLRDGESPARGDERSNRPAYTGGQSGVK